MREWKVNRSDTADLEPTLNQMAKDGWDVHTVAPVTDRAAVEPGWIVVGSREAKPPSRPLTFT